jgi:hypothetical protein
VLEAELQLAQGKLSKTQSTIDETLGMGAGYSPGGPLTPEERKTGAVPLVVRESEQKDIDRIQKAIAKLRGENPQAGAAPDPLSQARDAIKRGAPRDAVIKRLRDSGIDPGGL